MGKFVFEWLVVETLFLLTYCFHCDEVVVVGQYLFCVATEVYHHDASEMSLRCFDRNLNGYSYSCDHLKSSDLHCMTLEDWCCHFYLLQMSFQLVVLFC